MEVGCQKTYDCAFRVSTKIPQRVRTSNIEAASWRAMDALERRLNCGSLKGVRYSTGGGVDEHLPGGGIKHHDHVRFAAVSVLRCATFDLPIEVSGSVSAQVDACNEDEAQAKALAVVRAADYGNLRQLPTPIKGGA